mgnify:CR=1 FL=1
MKITYIHHSAFLVETESAYLLFDYFQGKLPEFSEEKPLYVFASHRHPDHFSKTIFNLPEQFGGAEYVLAREIRLKPEEKKDWIHSLKPETDVEIGNLKIRTLKSTDLGVAFMVETEGRRIYHAGDLNWWHWEGEDPVWNRNMEADFRRYAEPLRGRKIDLAMLPLDPRLGEDGFRGPRYFLELADIRRFLPMHQWGNFNFTNQFLSCYTSFTSRTVYVNRVGQVFTFEEEADT